MLQQCFSGLTCGCEVIIFIEHFRQGNQGRYPVYFLAFMVCDSQRSHICGCLRADCLSFKLSVLDVYIQLLIYYFQPEFYLCIVRYALDLYIAGLW